MAKERTSYTLSHRTAGIGTLVAAGLSYGTHYSVWWAILHALCSWGYVAYWWVTQQR